MFHNWKIKLFQNISGEQTHWQNKWLLCHQYYTICHYNFSDINAVFIPWDKDFECDWNSVNIILTQKILK